MGEPGRLELWVRRWGWTVLLILLVISAILRIWQMWMQSGR